MSAATLQQLPEMKNVTRRRLLGGIIGSTAMVTGMPTPAGGASDHPPINELGLSHIARRIPEIIADGEVRALHADLQADAWKPQLSRVVGHRSPEQTANQPYEVIAIPYRKAGASHESVLLWTDTQSIKTQTRQIIKDKGDYGTMQTATVEADGIQHQQVDVTPEFWWYICDVNWSCLLSIAGAWAGTIASCGVCLMEPTRLSCLSCAGAASAAIGGTLGCRICR